MDLTDPPFFIDRNFYKSYTILLEQALYSCNGFSIHEYPLKTSGSQAYYDYK